MGKSEEEKDLAKIKKCIGKPVKFKYPEGEPEHRGILKERSVLPVPNWQGVLYYDVIDLIEFKDKEGNKLDSIRLGYYRKTKGQFRWASQTTLTKSVDMCQELFKKAAKEMPWFRRMLEETLSSP